MTESRPAIETNELSKEYGSTVAVEDLDLSIDAGTIYGFLGPNGAGKTTTMRMLTGLVEPTDGEARVAGTSVENRRELIDAVGLLPEEPPLYLELTGREQLQFAADLANREWEAVADRALELCDRLDLTDDLDREVDGYSKGMRQKTAFVQAVQTDPDVIFLDEPTSGLDPRAAKTLRELIVDISADATVFLSTHILPVVEEIANEVGVLYDGQLVADGEPTELISRVDDSGGETDLEDAFLDLTSREAAWA